MPISLSNYRPNKTDASNRTASPCEEDLLTQRAYAEAIGASPSYVSRRTKNGGLVDDTWAPSRDAVIDEDGTLLGYREPTPRPTSDREVSAEKARKAAGGTSETSGQREGERPENDQVRENPSVRTTSLGQPQSNRNPGRADGLEEALTNAGDAAGREAARNPSILRGLLRLAAPAFGAVLAAKLLGRRPVPVALGAAVGFGLVEYSLRVEQTTPAQPTLLVPHRPTGLRLPSRHTPPGPVRLSD